MGDLMPPSPPRLARADDVGHLLRQANIFAGAFDGVLAAWAQSILGDLSITGGKRIVIPKSSSQKNYQKEHLY